MNTLDSVKDWMTFFGWEEGGGPGSVKRAVDGQVIARAHGATWTGDVLAAIEKVERAKIIAEIERREREAEPLSSGQGTER